MLRPILRFILLATTLGACAGAPRPKDSAAPAELAIRDVTVVDVARGTLLPHRTVLVNAGRITAVLPTQSVDPPAQAEIDGSGAYLIPGLWDMHVHLTLNAAPAEIDMPLMVANGVLGVREMVSDCPEWTWLRRRAGVDCLAQIRAWQQAIEAGDLLGPRILATGSWIVDDPDYVSLDAPDYFHMDSPERGRRLAEHYAEVGVDFVKIYSGVSPTGYSALVEHARELGLDVAGHAPLTISAIEASEAGQQSFEHARVFLFNCFDGAAEFRAQAQGLSANVNTEWRRRMADGYDPQLCQPVFDSFRRNGTANVPTHVTRRFDAMVEDSAYRNDPLARYIPAGQWEAWNDDAHGTIAADPSPAGRASRTDFYRRGLQATGDAFRAGVRVMLGTDSGDSYIFPGFAAHDELEELVKAGLTPAEALHAATLAGAEFLGRSDDLGTVEVGRVADLVLLEADPLAEITNTRRIRDVIIGGRHFDRAALDAMLDEVERAARRVEAN